MSKLKHYKGDGWEVKVKYDEEMGMVIWDGAFGEVPYLPLNSNKNLISRFDHELFGITRLSMEDYDLLCAHLDTLTAPKELTYDTVVKELEGLEGVELMRALKNYEFAYVNRPHFWQSLADFSAKGLFVFLNLELGMKRGLIKLRRAR